MKPDKSWFSLVTVMGNGPGDITWEGEGLLVRFNRSLLNDHHSKGGKVLWVNNAHHRGSEAGFVTEGEGASQLLDDALSSQAVELAEKLNCWPSSGLVTVALLAGQAKQITVTRMPLLPSLIRGAELGPRKPLACVYHNWLGERRLALSREVGGMPWPSLYLEVPPGGEKLAEDPFPLLIQLPHLSRSEGMRLLQRLGQVSSETWLSNASCPRLQQVESLFYLNRQERETANWWLYDRAGSIQADAIIRRLAWCQQKLFYPRGSNAIR